MANPLFEIQTSNAAILNDVMMAVVQLMGTSDYTSLLLLASMIGFTVFLVGYAVPTMGKSSGSFLIIAVVVVWLGTTLKADMAIQDRLTGATYIVNDTPMIISLPYWLVNTVGSDFSILSKQYFSVPTGADLSDGVGYGTALIATMQDVQWSKANTGVASIAASDLENISVQASITNYIEGCYRPYSNSVIQGDQMSMVLYADSTQVNTPEEVWELFEVDIIRNIGTHLSGASAVDVVSCKTAYSSLKAVFKSTTWQNAVVDDLVDTYLNYSNLMSRPGYASAGGGSGSAQTSQFAAKIKADATSYVSMLFGIGTSDMSSVASILLMDYLSKALNDNLTQQGQLTVGGAGGSVGSAWLDATNQRNLKMAAEGDFFNRYAGPMTRFMEFISYLWIPIVLVMLLFNPSASGSKQLVTLFMIYAWINLWPFAFNIINYFQVITTIAAMADVIDGKFNMSELEYAFSQAQRAYSTSQMFLGMLPMITMALLTGNAMSLSRISEKMGGEENLDESRIFRDTEKTGALRDVGSNTTVTQDESRNIVSEDSNVKGAWKTSIGNTLSSQSTDLQAKAIAAESSANTSLNHGLTHMDTAAQQHAFLQANSSAIGVSSKFDTNHLRSADGTISKSQEKMDSLATAIQGKAGFGANVGKGDILSGMAGVQGSLTNTQMETIKTAMAAKEMTQESAASTLSDSNAWTATDTLSGTHSTGNSESAAYLDSANESTKKAQSASAQSTKMKARANNLSTRQDITTGKTAEIGNNTFAEMSRNLDIINEGEDNVDPETYGDAVQYAEQYGGVEAFKKVGNHIHSVEGREELEKFKRHNSAEFKSGGFTADTRSGLAKVYQLQQNVSGQAFDDLFYGSFNNPGDSTVDEIGELNDSKLQENLKEQVKGNPDLEYAAGAGADQATQRAALADSTTNDINITPESVEETPEQMKAAAKLTQESNKNKAQHDANAYKGGKLTADVIASLQANDNTNNDISDYKELYGNPNASSNADSPYHMRNGMDSIEAGSSKIKGRYENLVEGTYSSAWQGYSDNVATGNMDSHEAEVLRVGEIAGLMGTDKQNKYMDAYHEHDAAIGGQWDAEAFGAFQNRDDVSALGMEMNHRGINTDIMDNQTIAKGLDPDLQIGTLDKAVNWAASSFGLAPSYANEYAEQEAKQEFAVGAITEATENGNNKYVLASMEAETNLRNTVNAGLEAGRGGQTFKPMDMALAELQSYVPYAETDDKAGAYKEFIDEIIESNFLKESGTMEGLTEQLDSKFKDSQFAEYREMTSDAYTEIRQELEDKNREIAMDNSNNGTYQRL